MSTRGRRARARRRARVLLTVLLTCAALTVVGSAGSGVLTRPDSFVPDRSTPASTVLAFVAAVQARATSVAWGMVAPDERIRRVMAASIDDPPTVSDVRVEPGPPSGVRVDPEPGYREVVEVRVTFFVHDRSAAGFGHGHTWWGYRVVRNGSDEPWSIAGSGL